LKLFLVLELVLVLDLAQLVQLPALVQVSAADMRPWIVLPGGCSRILWQWVVRRTLVQHIECTRLQV